LRLSHQHEQACHHGTGLRLFALPAGAMAGGYCAEWG
jgi:hypothetical protein